MHIAITLSKEIIQDIKTYKKRFELRKRIPGFFDYNKDYVAVVEKGTKRCPIFLGIHSFEYVRTEIIRAFLPIWAEKLCVPQKWLEDYIKGEDYLVLWRLGAVHEIVDPEHFYRGLALKQNPQSYVYIK